MSKPKGLDENGIIVDAVLYERSRKAIARWKLRKWRKERGPYNPEPAISPQHHCCPKSELKGRK